MEDNRAGGIRHGLCAKTLVPLLYDHAFILEGDHKNLSFIHQGSSPKVVRWQLFTQSLSFVYRHIPGEENVFPDRLSSRSSMKITRSLRLYTVLL